MIYREFALIVTVLTLGVGGTMVLASSSHKPSSSVLLAETKILAQKEEDGKPGRRARAEQFQRALNLSDQQMQQLGEIRKKYRPQMQSLAQQMQGKAQELNRMMQGNASEDQLRSKHQEIANLRQQMGNIRFESMLEMRKILTAEQRQKLAQFLQQRRQGRGGNRPNSGVMP